MNKINELMNKLCQNGVEYKKLKDVSIMKRGTSATRKTLKEGNIPVISGGKEPAFYCDTFNRTGEIITVAGSGAGAGFINFWNIPIFVCDAFSINGNDDVNIRFLYHYLLSIQDKIYATKRGSGVPHVHISSIENFEIPVPPLSIQEEIVRILDKFTELTTELTTELDMRKKQYEWYRDELFKFKYTTQKVELGNVLKSLKTGLNPRKFFQLNTDDSSNYYVTIREIQNNKIILNNNTDKINDEALELCNNRSNLEVGDVLFSGTGTIGATALILNEPTNWNIKEGIYSLKPDENKILPKFLMYILQTKEVRKSIHNKVVGSTVKSISMRDLEKINISLPPLEEQRRIVDILDRFEEYCNDITKGLPAEIELRKKQYEWYRDKLLSFGRK